MKTLLAIALAAVAALAFTSSASAAPTPSLSTGTAKAYAARDMDAYADFRMERGGAVDDWDGATDFVWDDFTSGPSKCHRVRRNVVDCRLWVSLYESDADDDDSYSASEDCRWTMRYRRAARGGAVSSYMPGSGGGGDFSSVDCTGDYGDEDDGDDA